MVVAIFSGVCYDSHCKFLRAHRLTRLFTMEIWGRVCRPWMESCLTGGGYDLNHNR